MGSTTHQLRSNTIRIIQIVKLRKAASLKSIRSSGDLRQTTKAIGLKAEERRRHTSNERRKLLDKAHITSTFNALY